MWLSEGVLAHPGAYQQMRGTLDPSSVKDWGTTASNGPVLLSALMQAAAGHLTGWRLLCSEGTMILTLKAQLSQLQLIPLRDECPRYLLADSQIVHGKMRTLDWPW